MRAKLTFSVINYQYDTRNTTLLWLGNCIKLNGGCLDTRLRTHTHTYDKHIALQIVIYMCNNL